MNMTKAQAAAEIKRLRKQAENEGIPQDARNEMLDKANKIEYDFYEKEKKMAKGGAVKKAPAKKTMADKKPASKAAASRQSPVLAVMIGMTDKKPAAKKTMKGKK